LLPPPPGHSHPADKASRLQVETNTSSPSSCTPTRTDLFLRLALAGVFDCFPDLQVLLGHWREVVLFYLDRADRGRVAGGNWDALVAGVRR
jgi:predicted TIM-barrel fold metal-dependent hydrolase